MKETIKPEVTVPQYTEVTVHNILSMRFGIQMAINRAVFIAFDAEFSGLGERRQAIRSESVATRYQALAKVAQSYALLTLGLTTFEPAPSTASTSSSQDATLEHPYVVNNFSFLLKCQKDFTVSSASLSFLADTGLDLSRVMRDGIPYTPGVPTPSDTPTSDDSMTNPEQCLRALFQYALSKRVPFIIHNGLLDICFLYEALYTQLPDTLESFVADLCEMFPGGIYDTKYIADFVDRENTSFLAYLYRKYEREQVTKKLKGEMHYLTFAPSQPLVVKASSKMAVTNGGAEGVQGKSSKKHRLYCEQFASYGYCKNGRNCPNSHNLDVILDCEENGSLKNMKKKLRKIKTEDTSSKDDGTTSPDSAGANDKEDTSTKTEDINMEVADGTAHDKAPGKKEQPYFNSSSSAITSHAAKSLPATTAVFEVYHSAAFDAYMTGCVFARQQLHHTVKGGNGVKEHVNKINVMGKDKPLLIQVSPWSKTSQRHREMTVRLNCSSNGGKRMSCASS
ncbi:hypothetical protein SeMB42_g03014 [Synchytrium endobioticum]|uniref:C3H1-type domain-containing protein n=1 Tax=Synchytrium endobioticum TaxID=286115 RepID=A0A507D9V6_9FUNG|nr:hypothetical protein SeLEV6574_g02899 [Synchytrium endobioticum]TPX48412.1 hypothetical protein SeMB42_g03014 [Synchytrium endobioticum]